jgi:hypothetical protein
MRFRIQESVVNIAQSSKFHELRSGFHKLDRNHCLYEAFVCVGCHPPMTSEE